MFGPLRNRPENHRPRSSIRECLFRDKHTQTHRSFAVRSPSPYLCNADGVCMSVRTLLSELHESARSQVTNRAAIYPRGRCLCFLIPPLPSFLCLCENTILWSPGGRFCKEQSAKGKSISVFLKEEEEDDPTPRLPLATLSKCLLW